MVGGVSDPVLLEPALRAELDLLYVRYARTIDAGDGVGWAACFTPDGRFVSAGGATAVGAAELAAFARGMHAGWTRDGLSGRHWASNLLVDASSGTGEDQVLRASCYGFVLTARANEAPGFLLSSVYADRVVRTGGAWRFAERVSTRDTP
jgi:3-phenylpropionate/cinnamic acid dioxygenase small subunit